MELLSVTVMKANKRFSFEHRLKGLHFKVLKPQDFAYHCCFKGSRIHYCRLYEI